MSASSEEERDSDLDSDEELQKLHASGKLAPGLHVLVPHIKKIRVNDIVGMKTKLEELKLNLDWIEFLDVTNDLAPLAPEIQKEFGDLEVVKSTKGVRQSAEDDVNNDFKREMTFYRQAQKAVLECIPKLHKEGVRTKRPDDYFAEMAKTDEHMKKIREKLLSKEIALERSEKAKKLRELRKYGKQIQHEVLQKRQKEKKEILASVKKYKKGQSKNLDFLQDNLQKSNQTKNQKFPQKKGPRLKRENKSVKYGYGGQKKRSKYNTADSAADMSSFRAKKFSMPPGKKLKKNQRPGKSVRQKLKNRRRR